MNGFNMNLVEMNEYVKDVKSFFLDHQNVNRSPPIHPLVQVLLELKLMFNMIRMMIDRRKSTILIYLHHTNVSFVYRRSKLIFEIRNY